MLRYLTAGESHGQALVVIVDSLPAGLEVTAEQVQNELARRRLGYGRDHDSALKKMRSYCSVEFDMVALLVRLLQLKSRIVSGREAMYGTKRCHQRPARQRSHSLSHVPVTPI